MFDLRNKRDLQVVREESPMPVASRGSWCKRSKVANVSSEIGHAVEAQGYYMRKLKRIKAEPSAR
jgi:hypothetical protein